MAHVSDFPLAERFPGDIKFLFDLGLQTAEQARTAAAFAIKLESEGPEVVANFIDSALDLIGDIFDPFLPGGAGADLRASAGLPGAGPRASAARRLAGLNGGGRRRRRRVALTNNDIRLMLTIASSVSKKAAENFMIVRTRGA